MRQTKFDYKEGLILLSIRDHLVATEVRFGKLLPEWPATSCTQ